LLHFGSEYNTRNLEDNNIVPIQDLASVKERGALKNLNCGGMIAN